MDRGKKPAKATKKPDLNQRMDIRGIIRENALRFLPAKALCRCKAVCRDWKLQISAPFFVHNQSHSFCSVSGVFCQAPMCQPSFIPLDPMAYGVPDSQLSFLPELVKIKSSCNGLLCCQGYSSEKPYYICNPVNKQYKKLPKPSSYHGTDPAVVLIFEPSPLDFIPSFKLICAFPSADLDNACEFEMYSSSQDSWKMFREIFFGKIPKSGVHVNGVIYWQAVPNGLLAFDLVNDRCRIITSYDSAGALGMVNGKLCSGVAIPGSIQVRVLSNTFANTARMGHKVNIWEVIEKIGVGKTHPSSKIHVLCVEGDVVIYRVSSSVLCFNLKTKKLSDLSTGAEYDSRHVFVHYVNSLVAI
ncbi:hypothetical protein Droror1_Dr00011081 [Drosera rotundifolia]